MEGLTEGVHVLEERVYKNPVACILFFSGGKDNCYSDAPPSMQSYCNRCRFLQLLPASIYLRNPEKQCMFPVYSFGLGPGHDPIAMHAISDASGGTYSFLMSYQAIQESVAACIGSLLSVVSLDLNLKVVAASHGVRIKSVSGGRFIGSADQQELSVGSLHADEEIEFLVRLYVPQLREGSQGKTSLIHIECSYGDHTSSPRIDHYKLDIQRPNYEDYKVFQPCAEVLRVITRLHAAEIFQKVHWLAEMDMESNARSYC